MFKSKSRCICVPGPIDPHLTSVHMALDPFLRSFVPIGRPVINISDVLPLS